MMERIGKMLSVAAYGECDMAAYLLIGREMKEIVVRDTLTKSLELGRTIRQSRERGEEPVLARLELTRGWLLFEGEGRVQGPYLQGLVQERESRLLAG